MPAPASTRAFTLIELLIVVMIIAILGAVIVPQALGITEDAKVAAMASDVQRIRKAIEIYQVSHHDLLPGQEVVRQLTERTDRSGALLDGADHQQPTAQILGPFLRTSFPMNTLNELSSVLVMDEIPSQIPRQMANTSGWLYSPVTGEFRPNIFEQAPANPVGGSTPGGLGSPLGGPGGRR
jgi:prepilin-type N-terminal cleavage/methylation domain-containing protein